MSAIRKGNHIDDKPDLSAKRRRSPRLRPEDAVAPGEVIKELEKHILVDGFKLVVDLDKSRGSLLVDARTGREFVDLYSFFASMPVGFNHPYFSRPEVEADLLAAARVKVASADVYSVAYATFIPRRFARVMGIPALSRYFFIEGGAASGGERDESGDGLEGAARTWPPDGANAEPEILHFEGAFHGRSGYHR